MKKTILYPVVLGTIFGILAGISFAGKLIIITADGWAIGFYVVLYMFAAALGGPLAGVLSTTLCMLICVFFGYPELRTLASDPVIFWTNVIVLGATMVLISFLYRLIYHRFKMPLRLLPWIGVVLVYYLFGISLLVTVQKLFSLVTIGVVESWKGYIPQALSDIVITSLIWFALPAKYHRPLWYEPKNEISPVEGKV